MDEKQITRYFSANDLQNLFAFDPSAQTCTTSVLANHNPPADDVLASILVDLDPPLVLEYHEHDSLLEHRPGMYSCSITSTTLCLNIDQVCTAVVSRARLSA